MMIDVQRQPFGNLIGPAGGMHLDVGSFGDCRAVHLDIIFADRALHKIGLPYGASGILASTMIAFANTPVSSTVARRW